MKTTWILFVRFSRPAYRIVFWFVEIVQCPFSEMHTDSTYLYRIYTISCVKFSHCISYYLTMNDRFIYAVALYTQPHIYEQSSSTFHSISLRKETIFVQFVLSNSKEICWFLHSALQLYIIFMDIHFAIRQITFLCIKLQHLISQLFVRLHSLFFLLG